MQPHQQRVVTEKTELDVKLTALNEFIDFSTGYQRIGQEEQNRLKAQAYAMRAYSDILADRITAFK